MSDREYVVRAEPAGTGRLYDQEHPYTIRGFLAALEAARVRSLRDVAQVVAVREGRRAWVIRRFEHGRAVANAE